MPINHRIVLDNRPQGEATAQNFKMIEVTLPELNEGQVLVCHHYLSLDPYMRGLALWAVVQNDSVVNGHVDSLN